MIPDRIGQAIGTLLGVIVLLVLFGAFVIAVRWLLGLVVGASG